MVHGWLTVIILVFMLMEIRIVCRWALVWLELVRQEPVLVVWLQVDVEDQEVVVVEVDAAVVAWVEAAAGEVVVEDAEEGEGEEDVEVVVGKRKSVMNNEREGVDDMIPIISFARFFPHCLSSFLTLLMKHDHRSVSLHHDLASVSIP